MKFERWYTKKKHMFSPEENNSLRKNHASMTAQARRVWEDDEAGRPRRRAIMVIEANQKSLCNEIYKQLDAISVNDVFNSGLSPDGKKPATYYWINWNMSASEWDLMWPKFNDAKRWMYDGEKYTPDEILKMMGLQTIKVELPYAKQ